MNDNREIYKNGISTYFGSSKKIFFRIVYFVAVLAVFIFLTRFLRLNWQKLNNHDWAVDYGFLAVSLIFFFIYTIAAALAWRKIFTILEPGKITSRFLVIRVFAYSVFGKYLPGISWAPVARLYFGRRHGLGGKKFAVSIVYENFIIIISGFLLSLFLLGGFLDAPVSGFYSAAIVSIAVGLVLIHPKIFHIMVNFILNAFKREAIARNEFLKINDIVKIVFYYFFAYAAAGVGFYFLIRSFFYLPLSNIPVMIGAFALALVSGVVVIFAPSGLGVREAVLTAILSLYFSLESAIFISIMARIWSTAGEVASFAAIWLISNFKKAAS